MSFKSTIKMTKHCSRFLLFFLLFLLLGLFVSSNCHVLNYDSVTVCDGILKEIQCPNDENIHVLQGFYGKWRNHDCHGESVDPDNLPTCREDRSNTTGIVKDLCQGKNTCTLEADKSIYGEPCPDNKAYLYVTFFCLKNGKKLIHHRTMTNEEVVTVPSHGYIIREQKSYLLEEREQKEQEEAKKNALLNEGANSGNTLNPNPRPTAENGTELNSDEKETYLVNTTPVEILDFKKVEKTDDLVPDNRPLMFTNTEDILKVEDSLKFEKVKEENAETRKLKEFPTKDEKSKVSPAVKNQTSDFNQTYNDSSVNVQTSNSSETLLGPLFVKLQRNKTELPSNSSEPKNDQPVVKLILGKQDTLNNGKPNNYTNHTTTNKNGTSLIKTMKLFENMTNTSRNTSLLSDSKPSNVLNETSSSSIIRSEGKTAKKTIVESLSKQLEASPEKPDTAVAKSALLRGNNAKKDKDESDIRSTIICNGESKLIACLPEEGIKVHDAFYGKRSGEDCKGKLPYKDDSPTCSALDARENVQKSCNSKQTCLLFSDENIYGKSLCPRVNKYLHLTYTCMAFPSPQDTSTTDEKSAHLKAQGEEDESPVSRSVTPQGNESLTLKLCNGEKKKIHCNKEDGIKINSAFYGKKIGTDCRGDLGYRDDIPECNNPRSLDSVKLFCENQKSCELVSESALFGDDVCPGVNKYLEVGYTCK